MDGDEYFLQHVAVNKSRCWQTGRGDPVQGRLFFYTVLHYPEVASETPYLTLVGLQVTSDKLPVDASVGFCPTILGQRTIRT